MAGSAKLAELFVDITLRGGAKMQLLDMKEKIEASDRALTNNAQKYQNVTSGKILQMNKLAERQIDLAKLDQRTYQGLPFTPGTAMPAVSYKDYAKTQAKANVETEIANKQKLVTLSQAELRALSGKRGADLAQKTVQADRITKQVAEIKNQQMMIAQYGKLGATIRQNAGLAKAALSTAGAAVGVATAAVGFGVNHAVQQASPVHAEMLSKSFDLLAAQIGTLLLPIITDLAGALQFFAGIVKTLNDIGPKTKGGESFFQSLAAGFFGGILAPIAAIFKKENTPDRPATMPANFEAFDQAWRRIQQQAASTGPLEQQILDVQMRNLEQLQQIATNTSPRPTPPSPPQLPPPS